MDLGILWLALAAFGGGIVSALLGWGDSGEAFQPRKFFSSVLRAFLAAGIAAVTYTWIGVLTIPILIGAMLSGAGVDVIGNRVAGISLKTTPKT